MQCAIILCLYTRGAGKRAFVAGVADDKGFGWAIAKTLAEAGARVSVAAWVPACGIFETQLRLGKLDASRRLSDGRMLEFEHVYPLDASFDTPADVPDDIKNNSRFSSASRWTVSEVAERLSEDWGGLDILVHSLANGPEVKNPLLQTSRAGYLAAVSSSAYSLVSLVRHCGPLLTAGQGSVLSLSYLASERVIPGYGGGMSSAKAALESDTRVLAYEAGQAWGARVNAISAGPLGSRAAKAIGFIDSMISYAHGNAPLQRDFKAQEVANMAAFLSSPLASAVTGQVMYVDNGLSVMGVASDSKALEHVKG
ncbi:enoyl-(acyl carrier protein) reductase [Helicosporidium sp. ATCC 50920]|nr:enoyl-(acyl carrier protein) reductase [Helicosporidium sp. ATCC 50920]|eukprot:KDD74101.1 enoyl-(acyl carrier protein) reductase [Helicosporidium sp. ATCC 50920]